METSGHSASNPRLLAEAGIEAIFILHLSPEERLQRLEWAEMEFVWRPMFGHLGKKTEVLGHVLYDFNTSPLDLLQLDRKETEDPSDNHVHPNKTDPNLHPNETNHPPQQSSKRLRQQESDNNDITDTEERHLRDYLLEMSQYYSTPHLLIMVGSNMNFEKSEYYYQSL